MITASTTDGVESRWRAAAKRVPLFRSNWRLLATVCRAIGERSNLLSQMNALFQQPDPWGHFTRSCERDRFQRQVSLLDQIRGEQRFSNALEIGCAEGEFTELLAPLCDNLVAVDFSPVALSRARQRCHSYSAVRFRQSDLLRDDLPEKLDLIVLVHVVDYYRNPVSLNRIRRKVLSALRVGGYLLVANVDQPLDREKFWWSRFFMIGAERINVFFAAAPELRIVESFCTVVGDDTFSRGMLCQKVR